MRTTRKIMVAPAAAAALLFGLQTALMPVHAEEMKHDMTKHDMGAMTAVPPAAMPTPATRRRWTQCIAR